MEARDAIVSWLEQDDNFLRVTASSPFSPSTRRGSVNLRDVVQTESQALNELAAFVNRNLPGSNWDSRHAKQMLKHYLLEYRSTAEMAANPQFILDERDELLGIRTVQAKLNAMCRHFQRLHQLHDPVVIATKEGERKRMERGNENQQSNGQTQEQPNATQITHVKVHIDLMETQPSEREELVPESELSNSYENSETDRETSLRERCNNSIVHEVGSKKEANQVINGKKKYLEVVSKTKPGKRNLKGKKNITKLTQTHKKKEVILSTPLVTLTSGEEKEDERFSSISNSSRGKKRLTRSPLSKGGGNSPKSKKKQRVETLTENNGAVDLTPTQTTQPVTSSASEGSQDSPSNEAVNGLPSSSSVQGQRVTASKQRRQDAKDAAQKSTVVPDALRSAIAQVVSQRQQLLSRQGSRSDSDSGTSDIDAMNPIPSASHSTPPVDTPPSRYEPVLSAGFLPPLIAMSKTFSEKSNMERKRALFRAKQLAFEQLRWQRENELQQLELSLLRREMEARQSLVQQELKLQRMRMRADLIQPMIAAGANVTEIAERLRLL
ncbi:hypothetical protein L917_20523 [Phytophthora nicotianae]|uniref:Uncharacterized protein n=2 Tax=Phytophthora nicotianae TaxID=4792 RepID=V9DXU7_PHYNI|nr:hypothetical protein F443_21381 [Phytophthora nicotianae P1569]ETL25493.1 hypothetical protein L916_20662 [Phytophthora nicotianae]ETL78709.1 hypothetical protein L917_20523 [Phytophthora nicotianae]